MTRFLPFSYGSVNTGFPPLSKQQVSLQKWRQNTLRRRNVQNSCSANLYEPKTFNNVNIIFLLILFSTTLLGVEEHGL